MADETADADERDDTPTLLCVDDEPGILGALKRLFRPHGYRVLTAGGGAEGVSVLEAVPVDVVISDMRMPEMDGARFLEQVRARQPEAMRIILTGHADMADTIAAINQGHVFHYITKPWDDDEVVMVVHKALEYKDLRAEKGRLEALTARQNEELRQANASLETKVAERTKALRQAMASLEQAHEQTKASFITSVRVFSNLIELRAGGIAGHSRRVADLARSIAQRLRLPDREVQDVMLAGLLHDIGKIGLPDRLLSAPFYSLSQEDRLEVMKHPVVGQSALLPLERLKGASAAVRAHHERFDGQGFPDGLSGFSIPLGARILAVANDYDAAQGETMVRKRMSAVAARNYVREGAKKRYDPVVVDAFLDLISVGEEKKIPELRLKSPQLQRGMVLSRDLVGRNGLLLLAKGYKLTEALIQQMVHYEQVDGHPLLFWIQGVPND